MTMVGQGLGAMLASSMADRFGRKTIHLISHIALYLVGFGVAFAPNYTVLIILRFLTGAIQQVTTPPPKKPPKYLMILLTNQSLSS